MEKNEAFVYPIKLSGKRATDIKAAELEIANKFSNLEVKIVDHETCEPKARIPPTMVQTVRKDL